MNETPHLWSNYLMEVKARQVYTRKVFSLFQKIVKDSNLGFVTEIEKDVSYQVNITAHPNIQNWVPESYMLQVDKEGYRISCDCKGFEVSGILCAHDREHTAKFSLQWFAAVHAAVPFIGKFPLYLTTD